MPLIIPLVPALPNYRLSTVLLKQAYIFDVRWNGSDGAWYASISNSQGSPIVTSVKLVLGAILGRRAADPLVRQGALVMVDTSGKSREAAFDDLGTRVQMRYYSVYDVLAVIQRGLGM